MPSAGCSSRVPLLPIWWQPRQELFFSSRTYSAWLLKTGLIPFPSGPVPGNSLSAGTLHQRVPVPGRVVLRRGARIRRGGRLQVQRRPGLRPLLRRVDQPVPAHPDVVARLRQVGEEVAPLVVGHHDLGELRREVGGLGDHPHPRLGAARPRHHPRDVVADRSSSRRGGLRAVRAGRPEQRGGRHRRSREECLRRLHLPAPLMMFRRVPHDPPVQSVQHDQAFTSRPQGCVRATAAVSYRAARSWMSS